MEKSNLFKLSFDDDKNPNVLKFNMPIDLIERYCFGDCDQFSYILWKKIGGKRIQIDDDHFMVLYKGFYIDIYGIHTIEALYTRKLPIIKREYIPNFTIKLDQYSSYEENVHKHGNDSFHIEEVDEDEQFKYNQNRNCADDEYTEFIINHILNGELFRKFDLEFE